jgi:dihydroflavonol-4-reductase
MKDANVLVIGADGLLGSHLVRKLIARDCSVRVFIQPQSRSPTLDGLPVQLIEGDLLDADDRLEQAVAGCHFVFHCAAITDMWADAGITWQVNLEGTRRVLSACLEKGVDRLVFTGSASSFQFGTIDNPGDESGSFPAAYRGIAYMESKYRAMQLVREYADRRGLDAVVVAPTFLLGALDWRPSSGELIRQFIKRKMRFTSPGGRNFVHASDVALAMVAAAENGEKGQCYIAGGHNVSYLDFFTKVANIAGGVKPPRFVLPKSAIMACGAAGSLYGKVFSRRPPLNLKMARLALCGTYYSADKVVRELGMPQTPIDTAIAESVNSLRDYGYV